MKKALIIIIIVIIGLVALDKWLSHNDKAKKCNMSENPLYALRKTSLTDGELGVYGSMRELELYPYLMFKLRPNYKSSVVNVNSMGFRAPEIDEKGEGVYRIVIVGGSTAFGGMSTSDDKTFFNVLEKKLNEKVFPDKKYEIISAAVPSYNSMQELILIQTEVLKLEPDMVIIVDGFNDAINYMMRDNRPGYPDMFKNLEKYTSTEAFLKMRLRKIRIIRKIMERMEEKERMNQSTYDPEVVEFYGNNLDVICHLLKSYNIQPVIVFQPAIFYKSPLSQPERTYLEWNKQLSQKVFVALYDDLATKAEFVAAKNDVPYLDARYIYEGSGDTLFLDDCHLNDRAQEILADNLLDMAYEASNARQTVR